MIAGLTACGKDNGGNGNGGSSAADASLAKQYVFKEQALDLNMDSDNMNIDLLTRKGDTVYLLFETYDYSENGSQSKLHLATMKQDGTVIDTVELPMWKEGEAPATPAPAQDGEDPVDTPADGADGSEAMPLTEQETSTQDITAADMDVVDAPAGNSSYTYTSLNNCTVGSDGNVYGIRNYYSETYSDDDYSSTNDYALICWSADGTIKWEADLNDMNTEESYSWVHSIIPNEDGSLTLLLSGDKIEKCTVTEEGITDRKELPEAAATLFNNASSNIITQDGKVQIIYYDESNYTDMYIATYDPATDEVSEGIKLSSTLTNGGYYNMVPGDGDILYYADSNGLFSYNVQTQESKQIMSYINSDLATGSLNNFLVLDEEQFLGFYYDNNEGKMCGGLFTHVKPEDIKDRIVLTLAGNYIDYDLKRKVVEYNKSGDTYRIVVKEYSTYNTSEDYTLGVKQLNNDIISGGMPDILVVDSNMSMDSYIAKGLVANVDDLIANDEELSKNDYLQNVWDAYRVDGKLYYVIPSFYISTMVGKEAIFGDRTSITMEELQTIRDTMPEGTALFGDITRDSFLYTMMNYCGSDFVDVSTGKCAFDTDNFVAMLAYAGELPVEYGEDYWGEDYWNNYANLGDTFLENLQGLTTLKVYQSDQYKNEKMNEEAEKFRVVTMKVLTMQLNSITIMDLVAYGGSALGIIVALLQLNSGNIDLFGCLLIILLSAEFFIPMRQLGSFFHIAMNGMAASDKIFRFLDLQEPKKVKTPCPDIDSISIKKLSFSYDENKEILHNVSLNFSKGSFSAIVGESGSGKSTISSILMKRNRKYTGHVLINDTDLNQISESSLMENITYVSHQSYLFKGTIKDNLLIAKPDASDEELWNVLDKAKLSAFLKQENGLETFIEEKGSNFSGGQCQRLAFARALLHDSPVYIFDEATSNIDVESENDIMQLIHELANEKTVILISHRLANVKDADTIYVLENGNIVESGKHEKLLQNQSVYASLWNAQVSLESYIGGGNA